MVNPFEQPPGKKQEWKTCPMCGGDGKGADPASKCGRCKGDGKVPDR